MRIYDLLKFSIVFLVGFLFANLLNFYFVYGLENPLSSEFLKMSFEKEAPSNHISEDQIDVYSDKIVINIKGASIGRYAPTGSMKPTFDEESNGIRIKPTSPEDIKVGDIVTYKQNDYLVIHRVVEKGVDDKGIFYIVKGDNNSIEDGKIRYEDIVYLTVGMIW